MTSELLGVTSLRARIDAIGGQLLHSSARDVLVVSVSTRGAAVTRRGARRSVCEPITTLG